MASRIGGILCPFVISLQDYVSWLPNSIFAALGMFITPQHLKLFCTISGLSATGYTVVNLTYFVSKCCKFALAACRSVN